MDVRIGGKRMKLRLVPQITSMVFLFPKKLNAALLISGSTSSRLTLPSSVYLAKWFFALTAIIRTSVNFPDQETMIMRL